MNDSSYKEFRIPPKFASAQDPRQSREYFLPMVNDYMDDPARRVRKAEGAILCGPYGTGKTWTAVAMSRAVGKQPGGGRLFTLFIPTSRVVEVYHPLRPENLPADETTTYHLETCRCLILEEMGAEVRAGGYEAVVLQKLRRLLKTRSDRQLLTFITSNYQSVRQIGEEMGEAIASLIDDLCPYQMCVPADAEDTRSKNVKHYGEGDQ